MYWHCPFTKRLLLQVKSNKPLQRHRINIMIDSTTKMKTFRRFTIPTKHVCPTLCRVHRKGYKSQHMDFITSNQVTCTNKVNDETPTILETKANARGSWQETRSDLWSTGVRKFHAATKAGLAIPARTGQLSANFTAWFQRRDREDIEIALAFPKAAMRTSLIKYESNFNNS